MKLTDLLKRAENLVRDNSSTILTSFGVSGALTTAYLAAKAGYQSVEIIEREKTRFRNGEIAFSTPDNLFTKRETVKLLWKLYIPTAVSGALTITCIVAGARLSNKKTAAAYSLLTISEKAYTEYREKVIEQLGERKEQAIRDEIAQDRVKETSGQGIIIVGSGGVLCFESHTGRYFNSDMETLRKAQNTINAQLISQNEANLNDFYYLIQLPHTSYSSCAGWTSDRMMELRFSTVMSEDGRPCISFDYNYLNPL